jgi:hypothetical protein
MSSESRIWEIRPFGSMRGGGELVIGLRASQSILSRLLYKAGLRLSRREEEMFSIIQGWRIFTPKRSAPMELPSKTYGVMPRAVP